MKGEPIRNAYIDGERVTNGNGVTLRDIGKYELIEFEPQFIGNEYNDAAERAEKAEAELEKICRWLGDFPVDVDIPISDESSLPNAIKAVVRGLRGDK